MKKVFLAGLFSLVAFSAALGQSAPTFAKPGGEYRPWVYWFWNNGNLTREGIDADLEAMQRVGIGGVLIMEVDGGTPIGPADYMGEVWREMFKYAVSKAATLGIEVNMNDGPGWNGSSGPWVAPENAMKILTFQSVEVSAANRAEKIVIPPGERTLGYYKDLCVLAFPAPEKRAELGLSGIPGGPYGDYYNVEHQRLRTPAHQIPPEAFVPLDAVVDLSGRMNEAGEIDEGIPPGNYTLLRIGVTCRSRVGCPSPESGLGPECDKLSKRGIENAFGGQMARLLADNSENVGNALVATHIDSWENGTQNWTEGMRGEFLKRRKYDLWKFLPIFAGYAIENPEYSERFLWDFRRTVSELILENYAGRMKELAGENGLRFTCEAYSSPCDHLQYAGIADEPMGEFWIGGQGMNHCRGMASAGHIYGKRIIGAEACTAWYTERWLEHPGSIKTLCDQAFCQGVNRLVFHCYSFKPMKDVRPGMTMGPWGVHYDRTQPWWELSPAWHDYLSRCQYMLRQGEYAADILYIEPEDSPQTYTDHPNNGYPWDQGGTDIVLRASVENGMVVLPSGMKYRVLVLPPTNRMTPELLEKALQLAGQGATLIGNHRATQAPGLTDYPNNDRRVKELARKLWGDFKAPSGQHIVGKGRVLWGKTPDVILAESDLVPAFVSDASLNWTYRRSPDAEIYFIANRENRAVVADVQFRSMGSPEVWNPETGKITPATVLQTDAKATRMALPLGATESVFVIFGQRRTRDDSRQKLTGLSKDGKRIVDWTKPLGKITVISAQYGLLADPAKTVDVKPLVEQYIDKGEQRIPVDRIADQQGGTAHKAGKKLVIRYEMDGRQYTVSGKEDETLVVGKKPALTPVKVLRATYGTPNDEKQIVEKLQQLFDNGENNFDVALATGAIMFKTLTFEYELNGKRATWSGFDPFVISLENEFPAPPIRYPVFNANKKPCIDFYESGRYELTTASDKKRVEIISLPEPLNLDDGWSVVFPHKSVKFDSLISWSESEDEQIKFFSGTATYTKSFAVPKDLRQAGMRVVLDLGQAEIMAQIEVNGTVLGVFWKVDKSVDITEYLEPGENRLKISVTNSWPNRLIGDAGLPASDERIPGGMLKAWPQWLLDGKPDPNGRSTFCTFNVWNANDALVPSGLIGPVRLIPVKRVIAE